MCSFRGDRHTSTSILFKNNKYRDPVMLKINRYRTVVFVVFIATLMVGCDNGRVPAANTAPVANAGPTQNVATGSSVTLAGGGSTGNPLTYSWSFTSRPAGSTAALSSSTTVNPTFTADVDGAYVVSLVVNDGTVDSAADSVTVTAAANTAPVANAGPAQNVATGSLATLTGGGSTDADGNPLTYSWSFTSKPAGSTAALSSLTTVNPTFTADVDGAYVISLVVNDGIVDSTADSVTVTASAAANTAPVANAGPAQNVATGSSVTLAGSGSDADSNPLTYSWSFTSRPTGSTAALSSLTIVNPTFTADVDGAYVISLVVNDGTVNSAADSVTVTASTTAGVPVAAATPALAFTSVKIFRFTWTDVGDATFYRLTENPDGVSGFTQVGSDIVPGVQSVDHVVPLYARINAQYILQSCNTSGCTDSAAVLVSGTLVGSIGYVKASNTGGSNGFGGGDTFGWAVSLAADGNTLAVGADGEGSSATGIDGNQADNTAGQSGAVYVFSRSGATWTQQAYVKASNTESSDRFGDSLTLSWDGNTLAVGARGEASNATGINGDQTDNSASQSGAVYVFSRSGTTWSQQAYVKASNTELGDGFGRTVSLAADGNTLAVGAFGEDSSVTGIDGNQTDNTSSSSGAVYVFSRSGATWTQQAYVKASNTESGDFFGRFASLAADGNTLAVGSLAESSNATGIDGDQIDNSADRSGAVYVFSRSGTTWSQQAYVKASNTGASDQFGWVVSLAADGSTLTVGAYAEASSATGIDGNQADNSASGSGAVYVFSRSGTTWSQQAYVKASNTATGDFFGWTVSLAADGNTLAVGALSEASNVTGINGDQTDNSADRSGAVYVFSRNGTTWSQRAYVKASNTDRRDSFGRAVSLAADGHTLAVGADGEASSATGIDGNQADNTASFAGSVYLY